MNNTRIEVILRDLIDGIVPILGEDDDTVVKLRAAAELVGELADCDDSEWEIDVEALTEEYVRQLSIKHYAAYAVVDRYGRVQEPPPELKEAVEEYRRKHPTETRRLAKH
jgi:hypothetical protein